LVELLKQLELQIWFSPETKNVNAVRTIETELKNILGMQST
jgi:hypothetical protein